MSESSAKIVFDYAKSCWDDELKRFYSLDDKLHKLQRFTLGTLALYASFLAWLVTLSNKLPHCWFLVVVSISAFSLISLLSALYQLHIGISLMELPRPPINDKVIDLLGEDNAKAAKKIVETYKNVIEKHRQKLVPKENCYGIACVDVMCFICSFIPSLIIILFFIGD